MSLLAEALEAYQAGYVPIRAAVDGTKRPLGEWKVHQSRRPTEDEVIEWFGNGHKGMGLVMGTVSGNAEMLEFEGRAVAEGILERWAELMDASGLSDLRIRLRGWVERSPSGGYHIHYRVDGPVPGNTKLAQRPATEEELADNPNQKVYPLIETRGEGGFVVVAPSSGPTHPSGRAWERISGGPAQAPLLTVDEHRALHDVCRILDQIPEPPADPPPRQERAVGRPGDEFNARAEWADILDGWTLVYTQGGVSYWRRPGKPRGVSATTGRNDADNLYVFSTSTQFAAERPYSKFAAYTLLHHNGDYASAARRLRELGYGDGRHAYTIDQGEVRDRGRQGARGLAEEFWASRDSLAHIRRAAWSRGRSAEAVLGAALARLAADTGHVTKIPAIVGSRCGLSLIVALTGPPGSGKSSSKSIATEMMPAEILEPVCDDVPPGSGEGILEILFDVTTENDPDTGKKVKVKRQTRHNAFVYVDEGEILAVQARRNTSNTILPVIRSVFTDGTLGQANATEERKRVIPAGHYTYGIVLGIQPEKAGPLFDDAGGGTPQRFLWMPTDTEVPGPEERPEWPGELPRRRLDYRGVSGPSGWRHIDIDESVAAEIRRNDHVRQRNGCDPLDEHADLVRLKVAALLAVLDGRLDVGGEDWALAEAILDVSNATRGRVLGALARQRSEENRARGEAQAERALIEGERLEEAAVGKAMKGIMRKLDALGDEGATAGRLRADALRPNLRVYFDIAVSQLMEADLVEVEGEGRSARYRVRRRTP